MNANLRYVIAIGAALAASAAFAQTSDIAPSTVNQPVHKASPPPTCMPTPKDMSGNRIDGKPFAAKQSVMQWRAPKLIGVAVYSADDQKVGVVKDVLIGHDGTVQVVVIGVGEFLGLGAKDVGCLSTPWSGELKVAPCRRISPPSAR
jgi:hypothetical protein